MTKRDHVFAILFFVGFVAFAVANVIFDAWPVIIALCGFGCFLLYMLSLMITGEIRNWWARRSGKEEPVEWWFE